MKIIRKLMMKNLLMNKSRSFFTILGIVLSIALITTILGIISSSDESSKASQLDHYGDYELTLNGTFDSEYIKDLKANRDIKDIYYFTYIDIMKNPDNAYKYQPFVNLIATDEKSFEASGIKIKEGRFPQNSSEVIITSTFRRYTDHSVNLGDEIELESGKRYYTDKYYIDSTPDKTTKIPESERLVDGGPYNGDEYEYFVTSEKKKFKVVGIINYENGFLDRSMSMEACVYTYAPETMLNQLYVALTDEGLRDFVNAVSRLTGVDDVLIMRMLDNTMNDKDYNEMGEQLRNSGLPINSFEFNNTVLEIKGLKADSDATGTLITLAAIGLIILLVSASCVFIIRNSFAISLNDKIKLYGMLSSIGATPKQMRMSVFLEAFLLGVIGIPLGLLLGCGLTAALIGISNSLLGDILGDYTLEFVMPFYVILIAAGVGILTVFFSAYDSSVKASKISPMEAIRSSNALKISKKDMKKGFKTPAFISKLFGIGGSIAWKNMRRSRRQYRATIVSIIISVALYLTVSTYVEINVAYIEETIPSGNGYNIGIWLSTINEERGVTDVEEMYSKAMRIVSDSDVENYRFGFVLERNYYFMVNKKDIADELISDIDIMNNITLDEALDPQADFDNSAENMSVVLHDNTTSDEKQEFVPGEYVSLPYRFVAMDDDSYAKLCRDNGIDPEKERYKAFIQNDYAHADYNYKYKYLKALKDPVGKKLNGIYSTFYPNWDEVKYNSLSDEEKDLYAPEGVLHIEKITADIAGTIDGKFNIDDYNRTCSYILVSTDWFKKNVDLTGGGDSRSYTVNINLNAKNPDMFEDNMMEQQYSGDRTDFYLHNYSRQIREARSMMFLTELFVYGFIIIIALIGVTNIFNTITTNMRLRRKEFAMFRSIGMTKREFNRMIQFESLIYTVISLMIAVPIGLLGGGAIFMLFRTMSNDMQYVFPWTALIISIFVVLLLLWAIMKYSVRKVSKMNIIETIRNDNT